MPGKAVGINKYKKRSRHVKTSQQKCPQTADDWFIETDQFARRCHRLVVVGNFLSAQSIFPPSTVLIFNIGQLLLDLNIHRIQYLEVLARFHIFYIRSLLNFFISKNCASCGMVDIGPRSVYHYSFMTCTMDLSGERSRWWMTSPILCCTKFVACTVSRIL